MSDSEENSDSRSSDESEESSEEEEPKKFNDSQLVFQSQTKIDIVPKSDNSSFSILSRIKFINSNLDKVSTNLQYAVDKYNKNTKNINSSQIYDQNNSMISKKNCQTCGSCLAPPQEKFDNFNNPYKKINPHGVSSKYSNNIEDLYKNQFNDYSKRNNPTYINQSQNLSNFKSAQFQGSNTVVTSNKGQDKGSVTKIYYRKGNDFN